MTCPQLATLAARVMCHLTGWWHHGDCVGADESSHALAVAYDLRTCIHPPSDPKLRAWCSGDLVLQERGYIERNHDIVHDTCRLIAAPHEFEEQQRSGTWATIRYARKLGRLIIIILPDGSVRVEKEKDNAGKTEGL